MIILPRTYATVPVLLIKQKAIQAKQQKSIMYGFHQGKIVNLQFRESIQQAIANSNFHMKLGLMQVLT